MASALVNNVGAVLTPETAFLDIPTACPPYGWIGPRISFSRDPEDASSAVAAADFVGEVRRASNSVVATAKLAGGSDPDGGNHKDLPDFEFLRLEDPVNMLPADELFSDGKLVPRQLAAARSQAEEAPAGSDEIQPPEAEKSQRVAEILSSDAVAVAVAPAPSPRAPRCSSRWRELLGLKKQQNTKPEGEKASSSSSPDCHKGPNSKPRSFRQLLHRHGKSSESGDASLSLPLLRESDSESLSISSRRSLSSSSSSSGTDHEDVPRPSMDSDKPNDIPILLVRAPPRVRVTRPRSSAAKLGEVQARIARNATVRQPVEHPPAAAPPPPLSTTADSPRMNASGKVVFQGLERSSSSPGSFNGAPRLKYRAMERSYSAGVRVAPVLNVVPVRSLRGSTKPGSVFGFGQIFSPQKKEAESSTRAAKSCVQTASKSTAKVEK